jgi:hypothetical protein
MVGDGVGLPVEVQVAVDVPVTVEVSVLVGETGMVAVAVWV